MRVRLHVHTTRICCLSFSLEHVAHRVELLSITCRERESMTYNARTYPRMTYNNATLSKRSSVPASTAFWHVHELPHDHACGKLTSFGCAGQDVICQRE